MNRQIKLYSTGLTFFPLWFLRAMPTNWIFLATTQFIIISFVLFAGLKYLDYDDVPAVWKKSILWTTLYGFVSYLIVCGLFFAVNLLVGAVGETTSAGQWLIDYLVFPLNSNPFSSFFSIIFVLLCLLIAGAFIYFMDKKLAFRKAPLDLVMKHKISLCLAVFSAPYITLFPSAFLYR